MKDVLVGLDLGGTQIRAAQLDPHLRILQREDTLTLAHEGLEPTLGRIKDMIARVLPEDRSRLLGIGISAPGPLNPQTGVVVAPPNLHGWHNVPLAELLNEAFQVPVYVGNDANVAALAEVARGSAQGYRHAIYITVSTGIGSGIIYDGRMLLGRDGLAAEVGHIPLVIEGGRVSTFEKEASGPSLARRIQAALKAGVVSQVLELAGSIEKVSASHIGKAANAGDSLACEVVEYGGFIVGLGIVTLLHLFNPQIIVIGGGVSNIGDLLFDKIRATVREYALDEAYWDDLPILPARLGGDVSIIGAAALVLTSGGQSDVTSVIAQIGQG